MEKLVMTVDTDVGISVEVLYTYNSAINNFVSFGYFIK